MWGFEKMEGNRFTFDRLTKQVDVFSLVCWICSVCQFNQISIIEILTSKLCVAQLNLMTSSVLTNSF